MFFLAASVAASVAASAALGAAAAATTPAQIIASYGYPVEEHTVTTADGFELSLQRIPHGLKDNSNNNNGNDDDAPRPPVFLQHGLLDSSCTWLMNGPEESLAFIAADAGFDVWLGNIRGNDYSARNTKYSGKALWDRVDFDLMASIDLPAMIDHALSVSTASTIGYAGHSQGTIMGFAAFPLSPRLQRQVNVFQALAPVAWVGNVESALLKFLADIDLATRLLLFGEERFAPNDELIQFMAKTLCKDEPSVCGDIIFLLCGTDRSDLNLTRMPTYIEHTPAGTSVRNMVHWAQMVRSDTFRMYDYGNATANEAHYRQATPPLYLPQNLTAPPVALYSGGHDILADETDVARLKAVLPAHQPAAGSMFIPPFEHLSFTWGDDAYKRLYPTIIETFKKYADKAQQ